MTDRELLEAAAKAAGYEFVLCYDANPGDGYSLPYCKVGGRQYWSPLTNDGDALRLAVKLNLTIKIMGDHVKVGWQGCGEQWPGEESPCIADMPAATRRAIVRAAAAIGREI